MKISLVSLAIVAYGLQSAAALAQSGSGATSAPSADASAIEEIVVTAQRRSEPLQDVPISVSAASAARLASEGVTTTQDLELVTPGLSVPQVAGFTQPHIRGVGSSTNGPGLEQPVATYIDGVYLAAAPGALLTLNNVDRIEILEGPQGTLFGRNATGGLIQVVTKDPQFDFSSAANLSYANYQDETADLYLTGPLAPAVAADVSLRYEHQNEAWGTNLGTGSPIGQLNHDFAGRTKFLIEPTPDTQIRVALDYEDRTSSQGVQHLDQQYPGTFDNAFFGGPYPMGSTYDINQSFNPIDKLSAGGASVQFNQDFGSLTFESITAYRTTRYTFSLDLDLTPAPLTSLAAISYDQQFTQEFQLSSTKNEQFTWVTGVYFYHALDQYKPLVIGFGPTVISPVPNVPTSIVIDDGEMSNSVAGYAQGTYEIAADTHLTAGVRYTYEKKELDGNTAFLIDGVNAGNTNIPAPGSGIAPTDEFKKFTYRVALDHKFTPDVLGYVSYNTGFKSGGYNLAVPSNAPYAPETIGAAEVGLKTEFLNHRLRINGAAYHYNYDNIQVGRYVDSNEAIYNGASAKIYGADFDVEAVLPGGFSVFGGFAYTHATFSDFPNADYFGPVGGCVPAPGGTCSGSANGKRLPFSPDSTVNVGANYKVPLAGGNMEWSAVYYRTAKFYAAPDNIGYQSSYDLINASVAWVDQSGRFSVKLWGKNLGNTVYAVSLLEAGQGLVEALGAPRTYGVTVGTKF
jgi:iron complex outermembrane receptor protein